MCRSYQSMGFPALEETSGTIPPADWREGQGEVSRPELVVGSAGSDHLNGEPGSPDLQGLGLLASSHLACRSVPLRSPRFPQSWQP